MISGGVFYHLRALRFGKPISSALWYSHREGVKKFLASWAPIEKTLVLVGPSGGYSLPIDFLKQFDRIVAFEPDFIARKIFEKRFLMKLEWITSEVDFNKMESFLELIPKDSAILFCNLLGQIPLRGIRKIRQSFLKSLESETWASYHDAMSGENMQFDAELSQPKKRATLAQMKKMLYPMVNAGTLTVNAHQAPELFEGGSNLVYFYWQWRILPKRAHLIEGVFRVRE
jgi:hypothetical protein